jgi:hypothetical protein
VKSREASSAPTVLPTLWPTRLPKGGERVVVPFGLNLFLREGKAAGHRLSFEYYYPVHEDLNGPQMSTDRAFVVSWQSVF